MFNWNPPIQDLKQDEQKIFKILLILAVCLAKESPKPKLAKEELARITYVGN